MGGLAYEAEGLGLADGHDVLLDDFVDIGALLAGEVAAVGEQRVGVGFTVRDG